MRTSPEITILLRQVRSGETKARERLFEELVRELRASAAAMMRHERSDHSLQTTALINEACLRLLDDDVINRAVNRRYLFAIANQAMRRVLVDHARARAAAKRGGSRRRETLDVVLEHLETQMNADYEDLDRAITLLGNESPRQRDVVEHRFLAGLSVAETASLLQISERTVEREWRLARAKLYQLLHEP